MVPYRSPKTDDGSTNRGDGMKKARANAASAIALCVLAACWACQDPTSSEHEPVISTELMSVEFYRGVTEDQVAEVAADNGLLVGRKRFSMDESRMAYVLQVDRSVVAADTTAAMIAASLVKKYPDLVESASAQVRYYVIE